MKKLLLASTALVMSAGVAAADVALSGDARMGLIYDGSDVQMTSRARVTFTLSGETDAGLAFGASFRADNATGAAAGTAGSVFISGDWGKLTMGDVAGAARAATGDLYGVGLTGLGDLNEVAYIDRITNDLDGFINTLLGAGGAGFTVNTGLAALPRALYEYSIDGFSIYASVGQMAKSNSIDVIVPIPDTDANDVFTFPGANASLRELAIGASYSFDGFTGALGYEDTRIKAFGTSVSLKHLTGSAEYAMDGFKGKVFAGRASGDLGTLLSGADTSRTQYGVSVEGSFDATTVTAFAHRTFFKENNYGIGASYDLGGGASLVGGVVRQGSSVALGTASNTVADFGVAFSF